MSGLLLEDILEAPARVSTDLDGFKKYHYGEW
jgi:hypothetical protein